MFQRNNLEKIVFKLDQTPGFRRYLAYFLDNFLETVSWKALPGFSPKLDISIYKLSAITGVFCFFSPRFPRQMSIGNSAKTRLMGFFNLRLAHNPLGVKVFAGSKDSCRLSVVGKVKPGDTSEGWSLVWFHALVSTPFRPPFHG